MAQHDFQLEILIHTGAWVTEASVTASSLSDPAAAEFMRSYDAALAALDDDGSQAYGMRVLRDGSVIEEDIRVQPKPHFAADIHA